MMKTTIEQRELLETLKKRFEAKVERHEGIVWEDVASRLSEYPEKIASLALMEESGGEVELLDQDERGAYRFFDCAPRARRDDATSATMRHRAERGRPMLRCQAPRRWQRRWESSSWTKSSTASCRASVPSTTRARAGSGHPPKYATWAERFSETGAMGGPSSTTTGRSRTTAGAAFAHCFACEGEHPPRFMEHEAGSDQQPL